MSDLIKHDPIAEITEIEDLRDLARDMQAEIARLRAFLGGPSGREGAKWSSQDIPLEECWGIGAFKNEDGCNLAALIERAIRNGEHLR